MEIDYETVKQSLCTFGGIINSMAFTGDDYIVIALVLVGISFLFLSLIRSIKVMRILRINYYPTLLWYVVIVMLLGFIAGYSLLAIEVADIYSLPISSNLLVAIIYFGGSIFTVAATAVALNNLKNILGGEVSVTKANEIFLDFINLPKKNGLELNKKFNIMCEYCENQLSYSVADVVRSNLVALDRGIAVEEIFGTRSYILRPTHICKSGRREYTVVHDNDLELRSIESSRIIFGGRI